MVVPFSLYNKPSSVRESLFSSFCPKQSVAGSFVVKSNQKKQGELCDYDYVRI